MGQYAVYRGEASEGGDGTLVLVKVLAQQDTLIREMLGRSCDELLTSGDGGAADADDHHDIYRRITYINRICIYIHIQYGLHWTWGYYEVVTAKLVSWRKLAKNVVRESKHAIVSSTPKKSKIGTQGHADIENWKVWQIGKAESHKDRTSDKTWSPKIAACTWNNTFSSVTLVSLWTFKKCRESPKSWSYHK